MEEVHVFAGNEACKGEEIHHVSARAESTVWRSPVASRY